ncbi:MAG: ABC transporter substrate-binding protein [Alphaproteobacteria bacterium]|nr:ABC transporter substrate-binding protein [Alphaproteobacteria bacterium]
MDADISSGSARSGIAIQRGAELAIDEINAEGGILGRALKLVSRDHRGNPARGVDNIEEFSSMEGVVAILGGLHTPVALSELKLIHEKKMIYLSPWAAGTPIVKNGYDPNFVFRVSVRDQYAGGFLVSEALKRGHKKIALVLENTGWGRSNERAMKEALKNEGLEPAVISWFHWGAADFEGVFTDLERTNPDVILLVANAPEGLKVVQKMANLQQKNRIPIISHWGITGGNFFTQAKPLLKEVSLSFLQTFSFIQPTFPDRSKQVVKAYTERYPDAKSVKDIFAPVGTAHAYDLVHLLARAIKKAGVIDHSVVRNALENLEPYKGLVRNYAPAFTSTKHDALDATDFKLASYDLNGVITPFE